MRRGTGNGRIELPCKFGMLVCEVVRDDDSYREFAIDLYTHDGKGYQVAVIGTNEDDWCPTYGMVHIYCYDGKDAETPICMLMDPVGDGFWHSDEEER